MRTDGVLRLILNVAVFENMNVMITGEKYIRFVGIEGGKPVLFLLKVKDADTARAVVDFIERAQERQMRSKTPLPEDEEGDDDDEEEDEEEE
ncbi:hypothetical protein BGZ94_004344, partial [Podila epigama]